MSALQQTSELKEQISDKSNNEMEVDEDNPPEEYLKKIIETRGASGLRNLGNTCYMNTIIQCIFATPMLSVYLMTKQYEPELRYNVMKTIVDKQRKEQNLSINDTVKIQKNNIECQMEKTITHQISRLFLSMGGGNAVIVPQTFKRILGELCPIFSGYSQHDSQEALNFILDRVHEDTKTEVSITYKHIPQEIVQFKTIKDEFSRRIQDENLSDDDKELLHKQYKQYLKENMDANIIFNSYLYWQTYIKKNYSIITDLITGLYLSTRKCSQCKEITFSFEPYTSLSIPIPDNGETTLENCLEQFSHEESVQERKCENCKQNTETKMNIMIWDSPEILAVHLKRFVVRGSKDHPRMEKLKTTVKFPLKDLTLTDNYHRLNRKDYKYELYAVAQHYGQFGFGHYVAYCKNFVNGKWYEFNDNNVSFIPEKHLDNEIVTNNAYVLFYRRVRT